MRVGLSRIWYAERGACLISLDSDNGGPTCRQSGQLWSRPDLAGEVLPKLIIGHVDWRRPSAIALVLLGWQHLRSILIVFAKS